MDLFRKTLIASFTVVLCTAVSGQSAGELYSEALEAIAAGNYPAARQQLETAIAQEPTFPQAYFELSKLCLIMDDIQAAQVNITQAINNDLNNQEFRDFADVLREIMQTLNEGLRLYDQREYMEAISVYERILENHPTFATAHYYIGLAYRMEGNVQQAAQAFHQAIANNPVDQRYSEALRRLVVDKYNEGNRLFNARDYEGAAEAYQEAYELDPGFHQAYYRLAMSWQNLGEIDSALAALGRATEIQPDYLQAYVRRGDILRREGFPEEAREEYRRGIRVDPKADMAWLGLGAALRADSLDLAIDAFRRALEINPESGDAAEFLGEIFSEQERWPDAREHLEQAVELKPDNHVTAWRLAAVYNTLGEYELARDYARRSTRLNNSFEYAWYELGQAEKALGNRVAAIDAFRRAANGRDASIRRSAEYELRLLEAGN